VSASSAADAPAEFDGVLFREFFVGRFSIGGDGPWLSTSRTPLTFARLKLGPGRFTIELLTSRPTAKFGLLFNPLASGGSWSYREVERAQVFESPSWAGRRGVPRDELPVGIRLYFGESRSAVLFFTTATEALLTALEGHHVKVNRDPIKLSRFLLGRR
jgi:hypothetical protein